MAHDLQFRYNNLSAYRRELAKTACEFFVGIFLPRTTNLRIRVKGSVGLIKSEGINGDVEFIDDTWTRPRDFVIRLDQSLSNYNFLRTLFHELVHLKQYAKDEMKMLSRQPHLVRWHKDYIDFTKTEYWDQPWEIEAYGREEGLMVRFFEKHKKYRKLDFVV